MWNRTFVKLSIKYTVVWNIIKGELFIVFEKYRYLLLLTINNAMLYDTYNFQDRASLKRLSGTQVSNKKRASNV